MNPPSGYRGVSWHAKTNKWRARVNWKHKRHELGCFDTVEEAADAVDDFRERHQLPLRKKPLRVPNSPSSVSFDVPRRGKWIGSAVHWCGCNWLCVYVNSNGTLRLRRYQDGAEREALVKECSRPEWWSG